MSRILPMALSVVICVLIIIVIYKMICILKPGINVENKMIFYAGVVFCFLGCVCSMNNEKKLKLCDHPQDKEVSFSGIVKDSYKKYEGRYRVTTDKVDGVSLHANIIIETKENVRLGCRIEGYGKCKHFMTATNYGQYDQKNYELCCGNILFLREAQITAEKRTVFIVIDYLKKLNGYICDLYDRWLPADKASIAKAMVLGDKSDIDKDIRQLYQKSGIAHIIAISGLHIAMFGGTIYHLLRRLSGSYPVAAGCGIIFIIIYGILTGLSVATVRAVIMLILAIIADVLGRKYDGITAMTTAIILMLVSNVNALYQAGFLLSFGAVIGISVIYPVVRQAVPEILDEKSIAGKVIFGLLLSISVQIAILPIVLYFFYEVPVYGVVLNILVVPLMSVLLLFLVILVLGGYLSMFIAGISSKVVLLILNIYEVLCKLINTFPFHTLHMGRPKAWWIILYYAVVVLMLFALSKNKRIIVFLSFILVIALFVLGKHNGELMINVFDVGQGDGIYIRTPANDDILIDGGSSSKKNVGEYILKNGIEYFGCDAIDYMLITHSDSDHFSGAMELLNDDDMKVENLVLPRIGNPDKEYRELENAATNKGCSIYYMSSGDEMCFGDVTFFCLNPTGSLTADKNENSIVLWMQYGKFDMLFTGDIDGSVEREIIEEPFYREQLGKGNCVEVLKIAHHGSATSSSEDFIRKTCAGNYIISVGEKNRYGHPAKEVVKRLQDCGGKVYMTKDDGAVTITTNGKSYRIDTYIKKGIRR